MLLRNHVRCFVGMLRHYVSSQAGVHSYLASY